jgi:hypothetical protein
MTNPYNGSLLLPNSVVMCQVKFKKEQNHYKTYTFLSTLTWEVNFINVITFLCEKLKFDRSPTVFHILPYFPRSTTLKKQYFQLIYC